jgi:hypothetical protein
MTNLIEPPNASPATAAQRQIIAGAFRALSGASGTRRRTDPRSLPVDRLTADGLDGDMLSWLLYQGHVHHFQRTRRRGAVGMYGIAGVVAGPTSSFTLTEAGSAFAARFLAPGRAAKLIALPMGNLTPHYNKVHRHFCWGVHLLKRLRQPASNQEIILLAAEEQNWPIWFDDPCLPCRNTCHFSCLIG